MTEFPILAGIVIGALLIIIACLTLQIVDGILESIKKRKRRRNDES